MSLAASQSGYFLLLRPIFAIIINAGIDNKRNPQNIAFS